MDTMENLYSTIKRFKSLKQHRDLVQAQYEHLRTELAKRFDELGITHIQDGETYVTRSHYRHYDYEIPTLKQELNPDTFNYITQTKLVVVGSNFTKAAIAGAISPELVRRTKKLITETDVIRIYDPRNNQ